MAIGDGAADTNGTGYWEISTNPLNHAEPYTVAGWIKWNTTTPDAHLWNATSDRSLASIDYVTFTGLGYAFNCTVTGTLGTNATTGDVTTVGEWHHVAVCRESSTSFVLFVNGVRHAGPTINVSSRAVASYNAAGHLDRGVGVEKLGDSTRYAWNSWQRALTTDEVYRQMAQVTPFDANGLHASWPGMDVDTAVGGIDWIELSAGTITRSHDLPDVSWTKPQSLYFDDTIAPDGTPALAPTTYLNLVNDANQYRLRLY